jgi:predicted amidophosphoribosyltransferase
MQPSTGTWDKFMYTLARWLLPKTRTEIATFQPVAMNPNEFWTNNFQQAAAWFRAEDAGKKMRYAAVKTKTKAKKVTTKQ